MSGNHLEMDGRTWKFLDHPEAYVQASARDDRPLQLEPTQRQFRTAKAILQRLTGVGQTPVEGVLLADDVGLGKTTVAALVACAVARTGKHRVRVLAPNAVMRRRWEEELQAHIDLLEKLHDTQIKLKTWETQRLHAGCIQVGTHRDLVSAHDEGQDRTSCDLLIVDEAHRAKGEGTAFREALDSQGHLASAKLILTATPFSIAIQELLKLLELCGAADIEKPVRSYMEALHELYSGPAGRTAEEEAQRLKRLAREAMDALSPYVIRHGIGNLAVDEKRHFGTQVKTWTIEVPPAVASELELLLRSDRLLRLSRERSGQRTNDPRFHVGWRQLAHEVEKVDGTAVAEVPVKKLLAATQRLVREHQKAPHPKMRAVAEAVRHRVDAQEKVLIFCHHRTTAFELLACLDDHLRGPAHGPRLLTTADWKQVWTELLTDVAVARAVDDHSDADDLREAFCDWLSSNGLIRQVLSWLPHEPETKQALRKALDATHVRRFGRETLTVSEAAVALFRNLTDSRSRSTLGVLRSARHEEGFIPGSLEGGSRVFGAWHHVDHQDEAPHNLHQGQPDIVLSIFNSPFGPDVLVTTDRLSEGVDLHRCCRLLVHYELDPSPIRTLQRNGRVRRVGSWAARTGQPIEYAYPSFEGTRDSKAVEIMRQRLQRFDLVLGGVPDVPAESVEAEAAAESFAEQVLTLCEKDLKQMNQRFCIQ